ncbi:MAG: hypothetical protein FVQ81_00785 [Candidatus Glassbacteria bacterium]|nr:hypothetical protein [Candidatus Glassbacteria bacterium]
MDPITMAAIIPASSFPLISPQIQPVRMACYEIEKRITPRRYMHSIRDLQVNSLENQAALQADK